MSKPTPIDLGLGILDHQLVDRDGRRCGKVDDLELEGLSGGAAPGVAAILSGPSAWRTRGLLGRVAAAAARRQLVRVPWVEVRNVGSAVELRKTARELRLGRGDDHIRRYVERLPGAR
jgi:sporulation protein YlmC with PRC-barrel domain